MKASFLRRMIAYIIDFTFILTIITLITINFPSTNKQIIGKRELNVAQTLYLNNEIEFDEYVGRIVPNIYIIDKDNFTTNVTTILILIIYFAVIPFFTNGKTLGKFIMKIRMIKDNGAKLTFNELLIRSLFINFILFDIILVLLVSFTTAETYMIGTIVISLLGLIYLTVNAFMISYGEYNEGIHDRIVRSKIIKDW